MVTTKRTSHSNSRPHDDIYGSFFRKFVTPLHLNRAVHRANYSIAILGERGRAVRTM